jgi:predicted lysophospholipase L1 biosynthesis ABC-type transport system permease subunit
LTAVRRLFALELRSGGWRLVLVIALVLGIGGGAALAALAGARRTASAFERLESYTRAADVLVAPGELSEVPIERIQRLPEVAASGMAYGLLALAPDGRFIQTPVLGVVDDHLGRTIERPKLLRGRMPRLGSTDEIYANPQGAAELGAKVGDRVQLVIVPADVDQSSLMSATNEEISRRARAGELAAPYTFTLVGIGVAEGDVVPGATLPSVLLPPDYSREHPPLPLYSGIFVRLHDGQAAVDAFSAKVRALSAPGAAIDFQTTSADSSTVNRSLHPQVIALGIFGLVVALGVLAAVGQALGRRTQVGLRQDATLGALGMTSDERRLVDALRAASVAALGGLIAAAVAVALSTLVPFGSARLVEPHPGISVDSVVLVPGIILLCAGVFAWGVLAAFRAARHRAAPSRFSASVRRLQGPPTVATGVRFALDPGPAPMSVPTRSTLLSAVVGLAAIIASVTFAASLRHFIDTPRIYGWGFDYLVQENDLAPGTEATVYEQLPGALDSSGLVERWSMVYLEQGTIIRQIVPLVGVASPQGGELVTPTIITGRAPAEANEVALGAATMRAAEKRVGDTIEIGNPGSSFHVVGTVVLPGLSTHEASDQAALGSGALLTLDGLSKATGVGAPGGEAAAPIGALVDVTAPGAGQRAKLQTHLDKAIDVGGFSVSGPKQPTDVVSYAKVRWVPLLLAAVLALLAAVTVGHALIVAVRQRRLDLAVLRSLGFTRGQVGSTVAWQATTMAVIACALAIPLGLLAGRAAWSAVAHQLGIVEIVVVPVLAVVLTLPIALLLANVAAMVPARRASALRPADALRAE